MPVGSGGIIGVANNPTNSVASGVWTLEEHYAAIKAGNWPLPAPTWDYDPMNTFNTTNDGVFVQSSTEIYLSGVGYDGGYKGAAVAPTAFKALQNSWNLDFQLNRTLVNASPFPFYSIGISRNSSASTYFSSYPLQEIVQWNGGNNYTQQMVVKNGSGTTLFTTNNDGDTGSGSAGASVRISFDVSTFTFTYFIQDNGGFDSMTEIGTYTLSAGEKSGMESSYLDSDFYINTIYRANDDGFRNINWYTV